MEQDAVCAALYQNKRRTEEGLVVGAKGELANVFVVVRSGLQTEKYAVPTEPVVIDQKDCWFAPRVVGIRAGQYLQVTNSDGTTHNIHPMPEKNREWNMSMAPGDGAIRRRFAREELMVPVKCNVHKWMRAWVGVVEHPYFAVTRVDGTYRIENVPAGKLKIGAWQETLGWVEREVTVPPGGIVELNMAIGGSK